MPHTFSKQEYCERGRNVKFITIELYIWKFQPNYEKFANLYE